MSAGVIADRYPATVHCPDGTVLRNARAILTRADGDMPPRLWLYTDRRPEPHLHASLPAELAETRIPHGRGTWTVATDTGAYRVERGRGCGCGSPLRRWKPWAPYQLAGMPPEVQR